MKKLYLLLFLQLFLFVPGTHAQQHGGTGADSIMTFIRKAMNFNRVIPQEKVYLHLDNTGYFENDKVWFKAYVMRTDVSKPSNLSKVLYVELLNMSGDVIKTTKWPIDSLGQANGDMPLDSLLGSGFYELRAYTRYATNWGANACFSRVVPVFKKPKTEGDYSDLTLKTRLYRHRDPNNRDRSDSLYAKAMDEGVYTDSLMKTISARFYPESGKMIVGKKSRVAVMVVDDNGNPYQSDGFVENEAGDVLAHITTDTLGRAVFDVIPDGSRLTMQMHNKKSGDGKAVQKFDLPEAETDGCVLTLDVVSDDMLATLQCSESLTGRMLGCVLMNNGNIVYCDTMSAEPLIEIELDRSNQQAGVNQFTVFDGSGRILAERMYFICPPKDDGATIALTPRTNSVKPCGKITLDVKSVPNSTFSFSAVDAETMTNGKQGNMRTWMLLSSDVRGYINNVDYYFEADDEAHRKAADMLMLTQGWRRYDWELMEGLKTFDKTQPIEDKFYVFGQLKEYRKRNPVVNVAMETFLYNRSGQSLKGTTVTDSLGNYAFEMPFLDGEWVMQIYTRLNDKRKTYYVGIDRQFSPKPLYVSHAAMQLLNPMKPNLFAVQASSQDGTDDKEEFVPITKKNHLLQNVTVKAKRRYFTNDDWKYKNENYGRDNATLYYDIDKEREDILDKGQEVPTIFTFLCRRNAMFENPECENLPEVAMDTVEVDYTRGMSYGGRAIKWIVDNGETQCVLNLNGSSLSEVKTILNSPVDTASLASDELPAGYSSKNGCMFDTFFPIWMEDIKSLYIVPSSEKEVNNAVRIYIYTHKKFSAESNKGLRRTYFQGFNKPSTFQMEDYSILPPMADYRRTIYWEPNVRVDAKGNATVEFFNNSTCREMYVSAEGMSDDGKILVGDK